MACVNPLVNEHMHVKPLSDRSPSNVKLPSATWLCFVSHQSYLMILSPEALVCKSSITYCFLFVTIKRLRIWKPVSQRIWKTASDSCPPSESAISLVPCLLVEIAFIPPDSFIFISFVPWQPTAYLLCYSLLFMRAFLSKKVVKLYEHSLTMATC